MRLLLLFIALIGLMAWTAHPHDKYRAFSRQLGLHHGIAPFVVRTGGAEQ